MSRTKTTSAPAPTAPAEQQEPKRAAFQPFEWVYPGAIKTLPADRVLDALGKIRDLTGGTRVLVQMLEQDELAKDFDDAQPLIGREADRSDLIRLAITASRIASEVADEVLDWARENGTKGGAA